MLICKSICLELLSLNVIMYTIAEFAKANDINVYEYLKFLLTTVLDTDFNHNPDLIDSYLPWSKELPEECRLTEKVKKHLQEIYLKVKITNVN